MIIFQTPVRLGPRPFHWTRDEYYRVAEAGVFRGRRVELINGEIVEMSPQGNSHSIALELTERALETALGPDFWVRTQRPLSVDANNDPEPDIAVVPGDPRQYLEHPSTAMLVVEISETSLKFDSTHKASIYARAGIEEYWIVNLADDRLDVYRKPIIDTKVEFGARYAEVRFRRGETVSLLAMPSSVVRIDDLLP